MRLQLFLYFFLLTLCTTAMPSAATPAPTANPLTSPWGGPYGGVPPFDNVRVEDLAAALEAGMADQLTAIEQIAANPAPPTFENTIAALERSGRPLQRVETILGVYASAMSTSAVQEVERAMAPKLAACHDQIVQNAALFARIEAVYEAREQFDLSPEQQRVAWLTHTEFVHAGARLTPAEKEQLAALNQQLATLGTQFGQNLLQDENAGAVLLTAAADLAGLPTGVIEAAAAAAAARGQSGQWAILNTRSSVEPFLTYATRRDLRRQVWQMFVDRGSGGGTTDNRPLITQMLLLRAQRAKLLGHPTHAHWRLEDSMAQTPERALHLMEAVWKPAVQRAQEEIADMQEVADAEGAQLTIEPWDYRYYAEKVRKEKYDLDENEITPYLQLDLLREGMFFTAEKLFGFSFHAVNPRSVPVYHPDVRVWEVRNAQGAHVGLWYFDPFARKDKHSGAWMSDYQAQERFAGPVTAIVSNNSNFVKGAPGEPVLISWEDATTLFHEFGHALHGLCSDVDYPSVSGTNVARDYVEFPSQLLEHWLSTPEILSRFALHYQTGQPIPPELVAKIHRAATFNEGFKTVEFLASALVDMRLHLAGEGPIDPDAFEREVLATLGMPPAIVMRHRPAQFAHIFSGDGYSAGYYSYLWADCLTADAWEAFTESGGPWDRDVADRLREHVFARGNTLDPAEAYRRFRGRDAGIGALMRKRGFPQRPD